MAIGTIPRSQRPSYETCPRVVTCYDLLDLAIDSAGGNIEDFTEGIYENDPTTPYPIAQTNQHQYLLDQIGCRCGSRLLDIGCGYGRLIEAAARRGARASGITISPVEVARCRRKGLDVRLLDYRDLGHDFNARFDGLVANGSAEHFVQPQDAAAARADEIYRGFFATCHRLLDPQSDTARLATTTIHFGRVRIDPSAMRHHPFHFRWGSDEFHYSLLVHGFGGFYPLPGQLARCAQGYFELVRQVDGTRDYELTSEHWLRVLRRSLLASPRFFGRLLGKLVCYPRQATLLLACLVVAQSWNWQFRGNDPPMRLLRQTWRRVA
jgi:cyclopropane fatty-acyl-phospholipid synthase-like methyltransferase